MDVSEAGSLHEGEPRTRSTWQAHSRSLHRGEVIEVEVGPLREGEVVQIEGDFSQTLVELEEGQREEVDGQEGDG